MKRRENDKRILALYVEMRDMMAVLVQSVPLFHSDRRHLIFSRLKTVKDAEELAPDGSTIKGRLQELADLTAKDIKACANAVDTYTKKKLVGSS